MKLTVAQALLIDSKRVREKNGAMVSFSPLEVLSDADIPPDLQMEIMAIAEYVKKTRDRYDEVRVNLNKKHRRLNEKGTEYIPESVEQEERFKEAFNRLMDYEIEIPVDPLPWGKLEGAGLTALDMAALKPIVDGLDGHVDDDFDPLSDFEMGE